MKKLIKKIKEAAKSFVAKIQQATRTIGARTVTVLTNTNGDGVHTSHMGWIILSIVVLLAIAAFIFLLLNDVIFPGVKEKFQALFNFK